MVRTGHKQGRKLVLLHVVEKTKTCREQFCQLFAIFLSWEPATLRHSSTCFCSPRLTELTYNVVYPPYSAFSLTACSSCQVLFCDLCSVPNNTTLPISKTDLRGPLGGSHCQVRNFRRRCRRPRTSFKTPLGSATREPARCIRSFCQPVVISFTIFASQIIHLRHSHSVEAKELLAN